MLYPCFYKLDHIHIFAATPITKTSRIKQSKRHCRVNSRKYYRSVWKRIHVKTSWNSSQMQSKGVSRLSADLDRTCRTFSFLRLPNYGRLRNVVVTVSLDTGTTKTGEWKNNNNNKPNLTKYIWEQAFKNDRATPRLEKIMVNNFGKVSFSRKRFNF